MFSSRSVLDDYYFRSRQHNRFKMFKINEHDNQPPSDPLERKKFEAEKKRKMLQKLSRSKY